MDNSGVVSILCGYTGFYSQLFFLLNHAIYAKTNALDFRIDSEKWLFKYNQGWNDYFENYVLNTNKIERFDISKKHSNILIEAPIIKYKEIIRDVYRYNPETLRFIDDVKRKLNLPNYYDSIFIRRGDKLTSGESIYLNAGIYIDLLLLKKPDAKVVYVQTDDYTAIEEIHAHLNKLQITLNIVTLCKEWERGTFVLESYKKKERMKARNEDSVNYISKNNGIQSIKAVNNMTKDEIKHHTLTMIAGVEFVCNSNMCFLDYQSNVSRFIKLFHNDSTRVFNILKPNSDIDYDRLKCPAYSF